MQIVRHLDARTICGMFVVYSIPQTYIVRHAYIQPKASKALFPSTYYLPKIAPVHSLFYFFVSIVINIAVVGVFEMIVVSIF